VLLHCFTCAIDWWDRLMPLLERGGRRVIAVDLLGHGGSEKPASGYSIPNQAQLVAQALGRLGVRRATVVGHSLGGKVGVALAEQSPALVGRLVIIDTAPGSGYGSLDLLARAALTPVIGEALWRVKMDWSIRKGLEQAFAPGYDVPDQFIDDVKRMTYTSYDHSHDAESYAEQSPLDARLRHLDLPLLVVFGAKDQIVDARKALSAYADIPGAQTALIQGAGHSPNVEDPVRTARVLLRFINTTAISTAGNGRASTASARRPSPTQPCARLSRRNRRSGARRGGVPGAPRSLPARCRNASKGAAGRRQSEDR
jgi:pimeloyl-ACP methyl ester carboxylesterase